MMAGGTTSHEDRGTRSRVGLVLAAVWTVVTVAVGAYVLWEHLGGPTVDAGERFEANNIEYRVTVVKNDGSGLVIEIQKRNTGSSPHVTWQAVYEVVAHAGPQDVARGCETVGCMGDGLQQGENLAYSFQSCRDSPGGLARVRRYHC